MKRFLIYTNQHKDGGLLMTDRIRRYLEQRGQKCSVRKGEQDARKKRFPDSRTEQGRKKKPEKKVDCVIVLGGDGTMLQAAGAVRGQDIPLVGVNLGTLGYMTEIEPTGLEHALDRLIEGDYKVENRMMLDGMVMFSDGNTVKDWALNDIVISRSGSLQILEFNIYVNGQFLNDYHADGVIVTTPTGSTGYNLSAGGPIVEPQARLIMLTPICPHTLSQRSIILSPEDEIEIEITQGRDGMRQEVEASFDGNHGISLSTGDRIRITKADKTMSFIRLSQVSFLETLHKKLSVG